VTDSKVYSVEGYNTQAELRVVTFLYRGRRVQVSYCEMCFSQLLKLRNLFEISSCDMEAYFSKYFANFDF